MGQRGRAVEPEFKFKLQIRQRHGRNSDATHLRGIGRSFRAPQGIERARAMAQLLAQHHRAGLLKQRGVELLARGEFSAFGTGARQAFLGARVAGLLQQR